MKRARGLKLIFFVSLMIFNMVFEIGIMSSLENEHFVRLGMDRVWADSNTAFSIENGGNDGFVTREFEGGEDPIVYYVSNSNNDYVGITCYRSKVYSTYRIGCLKFDTSSIPDNAIITSAQLKYEVKSTSFLDSIGWYLAADWLNWTTLDSNVHNASNLTRALNNTVLTGISGGIQQLDLTNVASINKAGYTGLRLWMDSEVAGYYSAGYNIYSFESSGHQKPQLIVTYMCDPTINITSPIPNSLYSEVTGFNILPLNGTVNDPNAGDIITTKYNIDGGTAQTVSGTVTTSGSFTATSIDISEFTEGNHNLNVWCVDNQGASSAITTIPFKVDKTLPSINSSVNSATNSITISGYATDATAGLAAYPYRYKLLGFEPTEWVTSTSFPIDSLAPNTQYTATFEARDSVGHIAREPQDIYTLAEVPLAEIERPASYSLGVNVIDDNPDYTEYQLEVNYGEQYITPEGTLTSSPVWVTLPDKNITVQGLTPETTYTLRVRAKNGDDMETNWSSEVSSTTLVSPPGSPANIIATATDSTVTLSWDAVAGSNGYEVEADGTIVDVDTRTNYTHTGLNPGTPHTYRIRAINEGGLGNWSTPIEKSTLPSLPGVPGNLSAVPLSTTITVTWDNVPGATGYDIEVDGALVTNGPNTNYRHTSLMPGTSHTYRVKSINPGGKSEWSSLITVTTLVDSSPVPVNINTTAGKNQITVTWDAVDGATGYEIEVDGVRIDNNTKTSYAHNNLNPGTEHMYRVRAKRGGNPSDWSAMIIAATLMDEFGIPMNFKAYAEDKSISLTWDAITDAVSYDVEIDGEIVNNGIDIFCMHEGLEPDTTHTYRVRANSEGETSAWSELLQVTTFELPTPKNIMTTASETSIQMVWEAVYEATSYELEFDGAIISDINDTVYTCDSLDPGSQHMLSIRAKNDGGTSNWSMPHKESTVYAGSDKPVITGVVRKNSITVIWNNNSDISSYDLEIDGTLVEGINGTSYLHNNLSTGAQHTYRVRTRDGSDTGDWSNVFTATTLSETPAIPTNVTASSGMTSVLVTWDKVTAADGYEIEIDGVIVDNGTGTRYLHNSLSPDTTHAYRVRAKNIGGYSEWSGLISKATVSSVQTYSIDCVTGDEFNLMLSAANIQDMGNYSFTVKYNVEDFDVVDLCGMTPRIDLTTGNITGTDIKVTQYEPGTIVFKKASTAQTYEVWSGIMNSIKFKAKHDGQMTITYSIN